MERRYRSNRDKENIKESGGGRERKGRMDKKGKRRKGESPLMGAERLREIEERAPVFSIITVDWLGLRATSCLLVFPFYITTNLILISYY